MAETTFHPGSTDALLIIDMQNDFCPGGALAVAGGDAIIPGINGLAAEFENVVATQDWHPRGHVSLASSHVGAVAFGVIETSYGTQALWPDHCVQGTWGAELHPGLAAAKAQMIVRKGFRVNVDSYSAFLENDHATPTGLAGYLRERGLTRLFLVGLAFDFCVGFSAIDGARLGFECVVVEDLTRAVNLPGSVEATFAGLEREGVRRIQSSEIVVPRSPV